jgi:acetylornithine deacetylase
MNVIELTRALVDIESITNNEKAVGEYLLNYLSALAARTGGSVEAIEVEWGRFNVLACWGTPIVTLSTHMDVVPPFFPSREDEDWIYGRGACDAKGIIAAMTGMSFEGVTGSFTLDDTNTPAKKCAIITFKDGANVFYKEIG